jgi:hypothetical protein
MDYNKERRDEQLRKELLGTSNLPPAKPSGQGFFWKAIAFLLTRRLVWLVLSIVFVFAWYQNQADRNRPSRVAPSQLEQSR